MPKLCGSHSLNQELDHLERRDEFVSLGSGRYSRSSHRCHQLIRIQLLSCSVLAQYLVFPLQMWMVQSVEFFEETGGKGTVGVLVAWLSIMISYSIASSITSNELSMRVVGTKLFSIIVISVFALRLHPRKWDLACLLIESAASGLLQAQASQRVLSSPVSRRERRVQQVTLLVTVIGVQLVIPRILHLAGLSTHLSLNIGRDRRLHLFAIIIHSLVTEALILASPSTFMRLWLRWVPGSGLVVSRKPIPVTLDTPAAQRSYMLTALHQIGLWFMILFIADASDRILFVLKHPSSALRSQLIKYSHAWNMVEQAQKRVRKALRLALLGRGPELCKLVAETWAQADLFTMLQGFGHLMNYFSLWFLGMCALCLVSYFVVQMIEP